LGEQRLSLIYHPPQFKPGTHLSSEQVYQLFLEGRAVFLDTRYKEEYDRAHIKHSINIPYNLSMDEIFKLVKNFSQDQIFVVYCANPSCYSSRRMAGFLLSQDYNNAFIYLDGFNDWKLQNYPVAKTSPSQE
jgi:rhodanese-related sulfurtransferase